MFAPHPLYILIILHLQSNVTTNILKKRCSQPVVGLRYLFLGFQINVKLYKWTEYDLKTKLNLFHLSLEMQLKLSEDSIYPKKKE